MFSVAGDFQRYDYSSATLGLLEPGYDRPTDADGVDTFYFGGGWDKDVEWCEDQCGAVSKINTIFWGIGSHVVSIQRLNLAL